MTKVVQRPLPHAVPFEDVAEPTVRWKIMLMVENERALAAQLAEAQRAIVELQMQNRRREGGG